MRAWLLVGSIAFGACGNKPNQQAEAGPPLEAAVVIDAMVDAGPDAAPAVACTPTAGTSVTVRKIGTVSGSAVLATAPPNDSRLFVLEQDGRIRIFDHEQLLPTPFLDLSESATGACSLATEAACTGRQDCLPTYTPQGAYVTCRALVVGGTGSEEGLLGLAFDPQYATNHQFYVYLTSFNPTTGGDPIGDLLLRYTTSSDPSRADPMSREIILAIPDFASNHNAGMVEFGADGDLYLSTGDGGQAGDPRRNGQNTNALLAKILRLDVAHPANGRSYGIPADNPFADGTAGAPEVFMFGLRNPWRWSFDRKTGDMWIGDVGQGQTEELDYVPAGHQAGKNFGWSVYEGSTCCELQADHCAQQAPQQSCDATDKAMPQVELSHADGWNAIIGGQVYRGPCYPDLDGTYFFTDHGRNIVSTGKVGLDGSVAIADLPGVWPSGPSSIHADTAGELYMTTTTGDVYHLEAAP
jgi:glucose/arabinose dehydrogenase